MSETRVREKPGNTDESECSVHVSHWRNVGSDLSAFLSVEDDYSDRRDSISMECATQAMRS